MRAGEFARYSLDEPSLNRDIDLTLVCLFCRLLRKEQVSHKI